MPDTEENVKLAAVRIKPSADAILETVSKREKRSKVAQASYVLEQWAENEANRAEQTA